MSGSVANSKPRSQKGNLSFIDGSCTNQLRCGLNRRYALRLSRTQPTKHANQQSNDREKQNQFGRD
jgi:hypothetical protein